MHDTTEAKVLAYLNVYILSAVCLVLCKFEYLGKIKTEFFFSLFGWGPCTALIDNDKIMRVEILVTPFQGDDIPAM